MKHVLREWFMTHESQKVVAYTKSEARARFKKIRGDKSRLPVGCFVYKGQEVKA